MDFLEKLQNKPRYIRLQILWLSVAVFMFIIVSFWVTSLRYSLSVKVEKSETTEQISQSTKELKKEIPSLMGTLKASLGAFFEKNPEVIKEGNKQIIEQKDTKTQKTEGEIEPAKLPISQ